MDSSPAGTLVAIGTSDRVIKLIDFQHATLQVLVSRGRPFVSNGSSGARGASGYPGTPGVFARWQHAVLCQQRRGEFCQSRAVVAPHAPLSLQIWTWNMRR
jgi:hypothetical protein